MDEIDHDSGVMGFVTRSGGHDPQTVAAGILVAIVLAVPKNCGAGRRGAGHHRHSSPKRGSENLLTPT